jgi:membrane-anchored glycerophosphoryl diester phosphodiesterase (GDPDase)
MEDNSTFNHFEMQLTDKAKDFLREVGKWANFLSILGFIYLALMVIFAFVVGATGSTTLMNPGGNPGIEQVSPVFMTVIILIAIVIMFFPIYYLNKFAVNLKRAYRENSTEYLTNSFEYLKSHYKFVGIMTIVFLSFYVLMLIVVVVAAVAGVAAS